MNKPRDLFIRQLADDLTPVQSAGHTASATLGWLVFALLFSAIAIALVAPFRTGWLAQLVAQPLMLLEFALGLAAIGNLATAVFVCGIPGHPRRNLLLQTALLLSVLWVATVVAAVFYPAIAVSMDGKRLHCDIEVIVFSLPLLLLGSWLLRQLLPLEGWRNGALLGLAAGVVPAWMMQLACMYNPLHGLEFHLAPALLLIPTGAAIFWLLDRRH